MGTRRAIVIAIVGIMVLGLGMANAAERERRERPQREAAEGRRRMNPERIREMIAQRMKTTLAASDEEWAVMQPFIEKIQTLTRDLTGGGVGRMMMMGARQRPMRQPENEEEETDLAKATRELQETLAKEDATADQITEKLDAYREAREAVKEELVEFQGALREIVTPRQEAQLTLMGILE